MIEKENKIKTILLDLDGTLSDFFSDALHHLNKKYRPDNPLTAEEYRKNPTFNMAEKFGISQGEFWKTIESNQYFWCNMTPFRWAKQLYNLLSEFAPVTILSSPSLNPRCIPDKLEWLDKHLGIKSDSCMFGGRKYLMARPDALLIDDYPKNTESFIQAGGNAVLIPSSWNTEDLSFDKVVAAIIKEGSINEK